MDTESDSDWANEKESMKKKKNRNAKGEMKSKNKLEVREENLNEEKGTTEVENENEEEGETQSGYLSSNNEGYLSIQDQSVAKSGKTRSNVGSLNH